MTLRARESYNVLVQAEALGSHLDSGLMRRGSSTDSAARPRAGIFAGFILCLAALALFPAVSVSAVSAPEYLLGPQDELHVALLDAEMAFTAVVLPDGTITLPYAGRIACSGKTLAEVAAEAEERFAGELKASRIAVSVTKPRPQYVYATGSGLALRTGSAVVERSTGIAREVAPGQVEMVPGRPVRHVGPGQVELLPGWRISHLLAAVGGLATRPNLLVGWLRRQDRTVLPVDLSALVLTGREDVDPPLSEGDVLVVERVDAAGVYVTGSVVAPGAYGLPAGAGAARAVLAAGGVTPGADVRRVVIWRANRSRLEADLSKALLDEDFSADVPLQPGDAVIVASSAPSEAVITIAGAVARPGYYALGEPGAQTVGQLLSLAGGVLKPGALVTLVRSVDGRPTRLGLSGDALLAEPARAGDVLLVVSHDSGPTP